MRNSPSTILVPTALALLGLVLVAVWVGVGPDVPVHARVPGLDGAPPQTREPAAQRPVPGQPVQSAGKPSAIRAAWPCFRGPEGDAINKEGVRLARSWPAGGPRRLWSAALGEGFAAAAVRDGCVYVLDHVAGDADPQADTLRCLSLDDGREIWRNGYPVVVPVNHGMSRTIPAIAGDCVVTLGPKCHLACWEAASGRSRWLIDLVADHGATVPEWHAGQCPLVDAKTDRLIVAPGGRALLMAIDYRTGKILWESKNPQNWAMTHSSIAVMEFAGRRMYVYCGKGGVAGVAADTGEILWETTDWQIAMATCPTPVAVGDGRIFLSGGYNAGSLMLQLEAEGQRIRPRTLFRLTAKQFGSEQQTPVLWQGHLYGIRQRDGKLVCLDLEGREKWNSGAQKFGSAPYMIADGLLYVLDDAAWLTMAEATPAGYRPLARAQVIEHGDRAWGPMAMVAGRLIVRDIRRMVCLDVAEPRP